jgi:hypothetical protein
MQKEMIGQHIVFIRVPAIYANLFPFGFSNPFQSHSGAMFDVVFKGFGWIVAEICLQTKDISSNNTTVGSR